MTKAILLHAHSTPRTRQRYVTLSIVHQTALREVMWDMVVTIIGTPVFCATHDTQCKFKWKAKTISDEKDCWHTTKHAYTRHKHAHVSWHNIATKGNVREKTNGTKNTTTKRNQTQNQSVVVMDVVKRGHKIISRRFKMKNHHCENTTHVQQFITHTSKEKKSIPSLNLG